MALYARIVDGVLESVGDLPLYARRLDTGELVSGAEVVERAEASGYYPLDVDPADVTADPVKQATLASQLAAALQRQQRRDQFEDAIHLRTSLARNVNWDWIDQYCHPTVGGIPYVSGQSPNAGQDWGAPTAFEAANRLRLAVSYLLVENIQFSLAIDMLTTVVGQLIDAADIDPPADR